jgi:hypothetical protein
MKPCPTCNKPPYVEVHAPEWYEFTGSCRIHCCGHYVCADDMRDALRAWSEQPKPLRTGEVTSL